MSASATQGGHKNLKRAETAVSIELLRKAALLGRA